MKIAIKRGLLGLLVLLAFETTIAYAGAGLRYSPRGLKFGKIPFEGAGGSPTSSPKTISISNSGSAISGLNIQVAGRDAGDFQIANNGCTADLGTGKSCTLAVTFTPTRSGRRASTLMVADDSNPKAGAVKLRGIGVQRHELIMPPKEDFGKVQVGTTSPPKTVTVTNPNKVTVSIQSIVTSGPFAVSGKTCASSLGPGKACQISVTFTPTPACNGTLETGTLSVANDAATGPAQTNLSGIATRGAQMAIFVTNGNSNSVTAYPQSSAGNSAPIVAFGDPYGQSPIAVAVDSNGNVYAPNLGDNSVSVFAACANSSTTQTAPTATIKGPDTGLSGPDGVALDASGKNIYVTNSSGGSSGLGSITVYPTLSGGDVKPVATIGGASTELNDPKGIALDSGGNIYVSNYQSSSVTIYPPLGNSSGTLDKAPTATITGANTGLDFPIGMALDSGGNIYATNQFGPFSNGSVTIYTAAAVSSGGGNVSPVATISGADTGMDEAYGVAVDSNRNVYVANPFNSSVTIYSAAAVASGGGDVTPIATIAGPETGLSQPEGIALASSGSIYVADFSGGPSGLGAVTAYPPLGSGMGTLNEMPTTTFSSSNAGVSDPEGIALDPQGNIYVANYYGPGGFGSVAVYTAMAVSGIGGSVTPVATISGANTGLNSPYGIALDSAGNIYVANLGNTGIGAPGPSITVYPPLGSSSGTLDQAPTATIAGANTGLLSQFGIAADPMGNILVANEFGGPSNLGSIEVFQPPGNGLQNEAPVSTISGANTRLSFPSGIASDLKGNVYVVNFGTFEGMGGPPSITVYSAAEVASGGGNLVPVAIITGTNTGLSSPDGIALDANGDIYVANQNFTPQGDTGGKVTIYGPLGTSTGTLDEAPTATITGSNTLIDAPSGIAIGPFGP